MSVRRDKARRLSMFKEQRHHHDLRHREKCAASFFVDPTGDVFGDTLQDEEGIAYADIDLNKCVEPKQFHDAVGYYAACAGEIFRRGRAATDRRCAASGRSSRNRGAIGIIPSATAADLFRASVICTAPSVDMTIV